MKGIRRATSCLSRLSSLLSSSGTGVSFNRGGMFPAVRCLSQVTHSHSLFSYENFPVSLRASLLAYLDFLNCFTCFLYNIVAHVVHEFDMLCNQLLCLFDWLSSLLYHDFLRGFGSFCYCYTVYTNIFSVYIEIMVLMHIYHLVLAAFNFCRNCSLSIYFTKLRLYFEVMLDMLFNCDFFLE